MQGLTDSEKGTLQVWFLSSVVTERAARRLCLERGKKNRSCAQRTLQASLTLQQWPTMCQLPLQRKPGPGESDQGSQDQGSQGQGN